MRRKTIENNLLAQLLSLLFVAVVAVQTWHDGCFLHPRCNFLFVVTVGTSSLVPSCLGSPSAFVAALFPSRFAPFPPLHVFLMELLMFCMRLCFPFINLLLSYSFQGSAGYFFVYILFEGVLRVTTITILPRLQHHHRYYHENHRARASETRFRSAHANR